MELSKNIAGEVTTDLDAFETIVTDHASPEGVVQIGNQYPGGSAGQGKVKFYKLLAEFIG